MANLTYNYRIYPNKTQQAQLERCMSIGWRIWNDALHMRQVAYENGQKISLYDLRDYWCGLRKDHEELAILPYDTVDAVCRRLDKAYQAFFRRLKAGEVAGFPKSKKRRDFRGLEYVYSKGVKILADETDVARLRLFGINDLIRVHFHRPYPQGAKPKMVVVTHRRSGEWYISVQLELDAPEPPQHPGEAVGIDVGMVYLLALSDGGVYENPRWYREHETKQRVLSCKANRRARLDKNNRLHGEQSKGYKEARQQLTKLAQKTARQREYFWHTVSDYLTKTYSLIALEDLNLDFMIENKYLAKSVHDAAFGMFWQMLEYKAKRTGTQIVYVPPQYTSQTCSECGHVDRDNRKTQAQFCCVSCGHQENADINAAKVILQKALNTVVQPVHGVMQPVRANVP